MKTDSGETLGQLSDFQNNSLLMLNENGVFKAIPWDQIVTMELNNKEEEQPIKVLNSEAIHPR
ncbi:MAG: hypothetical protein NHB15_14930 [Methanosarcina barkeri]|nr:hypothetical protein [Methanosarcina sp. ERenArc_MAG2]